MLTTDSSQYNAEYPLFSAAYPFRDGRLYCRATLRAGYQYTTSRDRGQREDTGESKDRHWNGTRSNAAPRSSAANYCNSTVTVRPWGVSEAELCRVFKKDTKRFTLCIRITYFVLLYYIV